MEEKVIKWSAIVIAVFTVAAVYALFGLPQLHDETILASEEYTGDNSGLMNVLERLNVQAPEEVMEDVENDQAQLKIELPKGILSSDVLVNNDYLTQTVTIQIPCDSKDYFDDYSVRGSSNHIDEISYYLEGETGTIRLGLDQVCELQQQYRDGILYLEFIDPHDIYDKIVVVDAGHGSRAVGASKLGINEKDINLAIVLQLKQIFENSDENIGVYYTRTDDSNPTLDQRVQLANQVQADLFISVHNNASNNGHFSSTNGTVVMYSESDDSELSSKQLAQICLDQVTETLQSTKVGLLKGDKIYIIRTSEVPVALIEVGFMTNREELANLNTPEYQQIAAQGIYNAILKAFEEGY